MGVPGQIGFIVDSISKQKTRLHVMHVQVQVHMSICLHLYTHTYDRLPSSSSAVKVRTHHGVSLLLPYCSQPLWLRLLHLRVWLILCCPCRWLMALCGDFAGSKGCVLPVSSSPSVPFQIPHMCCLSSGAFLCPMFYEPQTLLASAFCSPFLKRSFITFID